MTTSPTCPLPGCQNPTTQPATPCAECIDAFGSYLAPAEPRAVPATAEQITAELAARDRGIAAAYALQAATAIAATTPDHSAHEAAVRLLTTAKAIPERKANQRCWCCARRRTCTREQIGWACDSCRSIDTQSHPEGQRP